MMQNESHPADELAKAFQSLINGDSFKQTLRDTWDRIKSQSPIQPQESPEVKAINKKLNDDAVREANQSFVDAANKEAQAKKDALSAATAAKIRAKAKSMGKPK